MSSKRALGSSFLRRQRTHSATVNESAYASASATAPLPTPGNPLMSMMAACGMVWCESVWGKSQAVSRSRGRVCKQVQCSSRWEMEGPWAGSSRGFIHIWTPFHQVSSEVSVSRASR